MIDHDGKMLAALAIRRFVHADVLDAVEAAFSSGLL